MAWWILSAIWLSLRTLDGQKLDLAITTNGHLLAELVQPLKDAGLRRATISMDAVDAEKFARITRVPNGYNSVLPASAPPSAPGWSPSRSTAFFCADSMKIRS